MKFALKEPYKTGIIIGLSTFAILGVAYVVMPSKYRDAMNNFIKTKLKLKKDERENKDVAKTS